MELQHAVFCNEPRLTHLKRMGWGGGGGDAWKLLDYTF